MLTANMISSAIEMSREGLVMFEQGNPPRRAFQCFARSDLQRADGLRMHSAFTGAPTKIDPKVGGRFTAW
jgi:hypothetical protein